MSLEHILNKLRACDGERNNKGPSCDVLPLPYGSNSPSMACLHCYEELADITGLEMHTSYRRV